MFLFSLLFGSSCVFLNLDGVVLMPGEVMERFFSGIVGDFHAQLRANTSHATVFTFYESNRHDVFFGENGYKPVCCPLNASKCPLYKDSDLVTVLRRDGDRQSVPHRVKTLRTFVFMNCGNSSTGLAGSIEFSPYERGHLDVRLMLLVKVTLMFVFMFAAIVLGTPFVLSLQKGSTRNYIFLGCAICGACGFLAEWGFLHLWNQRGRQMLLLLVVSGVFQGVSRVICAYLVILSLFYPMTISLFTCVITSVIASILYIVELLALTTFAERQDGTWMLGFGSPSCAIFLAITAVSVGTILFSSKVRSPGVSAAKSRQFVSMFALALCFYVGSSLATAISRYGLTLEQTRDLEWIPFALEPSFFFTTLLANGWFWYEVSPLGWEQL